MAIKFQDSLEVNGGSASKIYLEGAGGTGSSTIIQAHNVDDGAGHGGGTAYIKSSGWGEAQLAIGSYRWTQASGKMTVTGGVYYFNTGNVGIKTGSPDYALDVNGVIRATEFLTVKGTSNSTIGEYNNPASTSVNLGTYINAYAFIDLSSSATGGGWIDFSKADGNDYSGRIRYENSSDEFQVFNSGTLNLTIGRGRQASGSWGHTKLYMSNTWGNTGTYYPTVGSHDGSAGSLIMLDNPHVPWRTDNAASSSYDGRSGLRLARNGSGNWWDVGLAGDFFHIYRQNSGEYFRIDNNGNVGINRIPVSNEKISVNANEGIWTLASYQDGILVGGIHTNSGRLTLRANSGGDLLLDNAAEVSSRLTVQDDVIVNGGRLKLYNTSHGSWDDGLMIDSESGWAATIYRRANAPKMFTGLRSGTDNYIWMSPLYDNSGTSVTAPRADAVLEVKADTQRLEVYLPTDFGHAISTGTANITNTWVGNAIYFGGANNYLNWNAGNSSIYSNVNIQTSATLYANGGNSGQWNQAVAWGNHASAGYAHSSHKYHSFANGDEYYDSYGQGNYLRMFTETATFDTFRFRAYRDVEISPDGNEWIPEPSLNLDSLLDGREDTGISLTHQFSKFRFTIDRASGWPTTALFVMQSSWTDTNGYACEIILETWDGSTWLLKDQWTYSNFQRGLNLHTTTQTHDGRGTMRVTILMDWNDASHDYHALRRIMFLSNFSGGETLDPWSWNYNKVVNFDALPQAAGANLATQSWVASQGYITSETDSQTLSWDGGNGQLTISNGNTVDLDGRYLQSLPSHEHSYIRTVLPTQEADAAMPSTGYALQHFLGKGPSNNDGHILGMTWTGTSVYGAQIWVDTDPNNLMAFRSRSNAGVWTRWNNLWHDGNLVNVSQLSNDAGYLTSFDITSQTDPKYVRSDVDDTKVGDLNISQGRITIKRGTGLTHTEWEDDSTANGRGQLILDSHYSDLIIASRNANANKHGSTLTFATQSTSTTDVAKWVIGQGQYQEGADHLAFAYGVNQTNPHSILGTDNANADFLIMDGGKVCIGGTFDKNAYSSTASTRLMFGGANSDAQGNYYIGTNKEDYGGNYTKLDLRWHTGIRMGAQPSYGGIRFFDNEDLGTRIMSIGETDNNIRIDNNLWIGGAGGWITDLLDAKASAGHNHDSQYVSSSGGRITKNADNLGASAYHLELYSNDIGQPESQIGIRFHQGGQYWGQLRYNVEGFRFTSGNTNELVPVHGRFIGDLTGTADSANAVAWANVSGKPTSFTPSAHTHSAEDITSGNLDLSGRIKAVGNSVYATGGTSNGKEIRMYVNDSWAYLTTNVGKYYLNAEVRIDGGKIGSYNEDLSLATSGTTKVVITNDGGHMYPVVDRTQQLGLETNRWQIVFCEILDSAGQHEKNLQNPEGEKDIADYKTGTVLVWKNGKNVPCAKAADHMRMGIAVNGVSSPLIQGAEPVLVTGPVKEGDYLVTSRKEGHAEAISPEFMRQHNLFDCVLGKALEDGEGESHLIKTWINI